MKTDEQGNTLTFKRTGEYTYQVTLHLKKLWVERSVGVINTFTKSLTVSRNSSKHLMRKLNAYGLCDFLLRKVETIEYVIFIIDHVKYRIPVYVIIEEGTYLNFRQHGFELQIFVPVETIKRYKV